MANIKNHARIATHTQYPKPSSEALNLKNFKSSSSEYVGPGHPDKIADQIADAIFDAALKVGNFNQVACEVLVSKGLIVIAGEVAQPESIDYQSIASSIISKYGYDSNNFEFVIKCHTQSSDIRNAAIKQDIKDSVNSGDQGIVFGFACNETKEYLPLSYVLSRDLIWKAKELIDNKIFSWAKYDMKSLVTIHKDCDSGKNHVETIIFSIHHEDNVDYLFISEEVKKHVIIPIVSHKHNLDTDIPHLLINSSKKFVIGGLQADTGLTNRKLMVDLAGPNCLHGGGGLSGKDLSKVDRLGAYFGRWICKNIVAAGLADTMELKLVYFLGCNQVHELFITKLEGSTTPSSRLLDCIKAVFPAKINDIFDHFLSCKINYSDLAANGHYGRNDVFLPWEQLDKVEDIKLWIKQN